MLRNEVCIMAAHYMHPEHSKAGGFSLASRQESTAQAGLALSVRSHLPLAAGPGDSSASGHPKLAQTLSPPASWHCQGCTS